MVSGGQEFGRSRQGGKGSRLLGIGVDSAKGFRGEMRSSLRGDEFRRAAENVLSFVSFVLWSSIQLPLLQHPFSFLFPSVLKG